MALEHITNHYERAVARLPMVYKDKPRYLAWLAAYCSKIQQIEDVMWAIYNDRLIQNSPTGDLLAKLASIVAQPSIGAADAEWLLYVKARILANRSDGRRDTLRRLTQLLWPYGQAPDVWQFDYAPASVAIVPQAAFEVSPYTVAKFFLGPAVGAGISLSYVFSPEAPSATLVPGSVHTAGFGATPPTTMPDVASGQYLGSVHASGFAAGPPPTSTGLTAGVLAGVTTEPRP